MRSYIPAGVLFAAALSAAPTAAQLPVVATDDVSVAVTGRLQTQFNTSTADSIYSTFETRRARLGLDLEIDEWITGRVEANFAHGVRLEDAWMNLGFHPAFQLQVGQFKKPFSLLELTSSSKTIPIERGLRIRGLPQNSEHHLLLDDNGYLGRELGAQVHGSIGPVTYAAGVFNGSGQSTRDVNDAKSYAGRLTWEPFANLPLAIGAAASRRDVALVDSLDETYTEQGLAVEADVAWGGFRRPGLSLVAEVMQAENFDTGDPMTGAQGIISWFQPVTLARVEGIEPLFRASFADPSTEFDGSAGRLLTPGINVYFHGRNRLMLNLDSFMPELDVLDPEHAFRAQLQLYF
ncbi:MAG TPA: porin [Longimicrobiales bacterium]